MNEAFQGVGHVALSHSFMHRFCLTNGSKCPGGSNIKKAGMLVENF